MRNNTVCDIIIIDKYIGHDINFANGIKIENISEKAALTISEIIARSESAIRLDWKIKYVQGKPNLLMKRPLVSAQEEKIRTNQDIRSEIKEAGLKLWQIAEGLGLNDGNFSRLLRHELSEEKKAKIRSIVSGLKEA